MYLPSRRHWSQVSMLGQRLQRTMCFFTCISGTRSTKSFTLMPMKCSIFERRYWYTVWRRHSFWYWAFILLLSIGNRFSIRRIDSEKASSSTRNSSAMKSRNSIVISMARTLWKDLILNLACHRKKILIQISKPCGHCG